MKTITILIMSLLSLSTFANQPIFYPQFEKAYLCENEITNFQITVFSDSLQFSTSIEMPYLPGSILLNTGAVPYSVSKYCNFSGKDHCKNEKYVGRTTINTVTIGYSLEFLNYSLEHIMYYISGRYHIQKSSNGNLLFSYELTKEPGPAAPDQNTTVTQNSAICTPL